MSFYFWLHLNVSFCLSHSLFYYDMSLLFCCNFIAWICCYFLNLYIEIFIFFGICSVIISPNTVTDSFFYCSHSRTPKYTNTQISSNSDIVLTLFLMFPMHLTLSDEIWDFHLFFSIHCFFFFLFFLLKSKIYTQLKRWVYSVSEIESHSLIRIISKKMREN